jgi:hypothetical protein
MGLKKELAKIADAVEGILGDSVKAKKLKKIKALERFIVQMKSKRADISAELGQDALAPEARKLKERHLKTLDKQIRKANKVLSGMK